MQRQKFPERHTGLGFPRRVFDADSSSIHGFFPFSSVSFKDDPGFIHSFIHSFIATGATGRRRREQKSDAAQNRHLPSRRPPPDRQGRRHRLPPRGRVRRPRRHRRRRPRPGPTRRGARGARGFTEDRRRLRAQGGSSGSARVRGSRRVAASSPSRLGARGARREAGARGEDRGETAHGGWREGGAGKERRGGGRGVGGGGFSKFRRRRRRRRSGRRDVIAGRAACRRGERGGRAGCEGEAG